MKQKKKGNIILIGMSGAGKSTLGVLLAKTLGKNFFDTDLLIQQTDGRRLQEIIDADGIDGFLRLEERVISKLRLQGCVIATGGSAVYSEKAMRRLREGGKVVYLSVDFEELQKRLSNITTRGIVFKGHGDLRSVYEERLPLYRKYADLCVECTGLDIETAVRTVAAAVDEQEACRRTGC